MAWGSNIVLPFTKYTLVEKGRYMKDPTYEYFKQIFPYNFGTDWRILTKMLTVFKLKNVEFKYTRTFYT